MHMQYLLTLYQTILEITHPLRRHCHLATFTYTYFNGTLSKKKSNFVPVGISITLYFQIRKMKVILKFSFPTVQRASDGSRNRLYLNIYIIGRAPLKELYSLLT